MSAYEQQAAAQVHELQPAAKTTTGNALLKCGGQILLCAPSCHLHLGAARHAPSGCSLHEQTAPGQSYDPTGLCPPPPPPPTSSESSESSDACMQPWLALRCMQVHQLGATTTTTSNRQWHGQCVCRHAGAWPWQPVKGWSGHEPCHRRTYLRCGGLRLSSGRGLRTQQALAAAPA